MDGFGAKGWFRRRAWAWHLAMGVGVAVMMVGWLVPEKVGACEVDGGAVERPNAEDVR